MAKDFISDDEMAELEASEPQGFISDEDVTRMEAEGPGKLESGLRGLVQGGTLGFADELTGQVGNIAGKLGLVPDMGYDYYRDYTRGADKEAAAANPKSYGSAELGGAIGTSFIPGLNAGAGAGLASTVGRSALQGGLMGAGATEEDLTSKGGLKDVALGAGLGGAGGLAGYGLAKGIDKGREVVGRLAGRTADALDSGAESIAARALGAERGSIGSIGKDKVKAAGRYALDEGILGNTDDMIARNAAAQSRAGQAMSDVYKTIDDAGASTFNPLDVAGKVDEKVGGFWRSPINRGETNQLENTLESILMRGEGNIPLADAQRLKEEIGKVANWKNKVSITDKERMAREAYGVVASAIDEAAELGSKQVGVEGLADTLRQANRTYSSSKTAAELLKNKEAREQGNKFIGLTDAITGAGALGYGGATDDWKTAGAVMLGKKGLEKYGARTLAVGADRLADIVRKAPQMLGKFAPALQAAAQRGGQGLAATHFILEQTQPEYQKMMRDLDEDN